MAKAGKKPLSKKSMKKTKGGIIAVLIGKQAQGRAGIPQLLPPGNAVPPVPCV